MGKFVKLVKNVERIELGKSSSTWNVEGWCRRRESPWNEHDTVSSSEVIFDSKPTYLWPLIEAFRLFIVVCNSPLTSTITELSEAAFWKMKEASARYWIPEISKEFEKSVIFSGKNVHCVLWNKNWGTKSAIIMHFYQAP